LITYPEDQFKLHSEIVRTVKLWLRDKMNTRYYKGLILCAASERVDRSIRGVQTDVRVCLIVCDLDTCKIRRPGPELDSYET